MNAHFELESIWSARLRAVREMLHGHETRITALEAKSPPHQLPGSPRSSINLKRLAKVAKASFSVVSFLARHGGIILAGITMVWAFILPLLTLVWNALAGFVASVVGVGSGL